MCKENAGIFKEDYNYWYIQADYLLQQNPIQNNKYNWKASKFFLGILNVCYKQRLYCVDRAVVAEWVNVSINH